MVLKWFNVETGGPQESFGESETNLRNYEKDQKALDVPRRGRINPNNVASWPPTLFPSVETYDDDNDDDDADDDASGRLSW